MTRNTQQREAILKVLRNTDTHPTADQIYEQVRQNLPKISKGTVYRNLGVLESMGLVSVLNLNDTTGRYEIKQNRHYHFRCEKCGCVIDIAEPVNELDRKVSLKTGFKVLYHQLEFRGLCLDCQSNVSKRTTNKTKRKQ
jgi:Fur family peroxide stress response transcriptional regulator